MIELSRGVIDIVFEGEEKALYELATESEVEMLFFVACCHDISYF